MAWPGLVSLLAEPHVAVWWDWPGQLCDAGYEVYPLFFGVRILNSGRELGRAFFFFSFFGLEGKRGFGSPKGETAGFYYAYY